MFHRVGDVYALPGPVFFRLAWRLPAYRGVVREQQLAAQTAAESAPPAGAPAFPPPGAGAPAGGERRVNPGTKAAIQADPVFSRLISFG